MFKHLKPSQKLYLGVLLVMIFLLLCSEVAYSQTSINYDKGDLEYATKVYLPTDTVKYESKVFNTLKKAINTIPSKRDWIIEFQAEFLDKPDFVEIEYSKKSYTLYINTVVKARSTNISAIRAYLLSDFYFIITGKEIYN